MNIYISIRPVAEYIDKQYEMYHKAESAQTPRDDIQDTRVHVLLYFIPPTGHRYVRLGGVSFISCNLW